MDAGPVQCTGRFAKKWFEMSGSSHWGQFTFPVQRLMCLPVMIHDQNKAHLCCFDTALYLREPQLKSAVVVFYEDRFWLSLNRRRWWWILMSVGRPFIVSCDWYQMSMKLCFAPERSIIIRDSFSFAMSFLLSLWNDINVHCHIAAYNIKYFTVT